MLFYRIVREQLVSSYSLPQSPFFLYFNLKPLTFKTKGSNGSQSLKRERDLFRSECVQSFSVSWAQVLLMGTCKTSLAVHKRVLLVLSRERERKDFRRMHQLTGKESRLALIILLFLSGAKQKGGPDVVLGSTHSYSSKRECILNEILLVVAIEENGQRVCGRLDKTAAAILSLLFFRYSITLPPP